MKKVITTTSILLSVFLFMFLTSCKKSSSEFSDKITLGTGASGFTITGESTSFTQVSGSVIIYIRIESEEDMAGRTIVLDFETASGSLINTITRPQAQDYGHILLSSFDWLGDKGNFTVNAYLADGTEKILITSQDFTIQ